MEDQRVEKEMWCTNGGNKISEGEELIEKTLARISTCRGNPKYGDDREVEDRDDIRHEVGSHDEYPCYDGDPELETPPSRRRGNEHMASERLQEEEPNSRDTHSSDDRDRTCREIETHLRSGRYRWESDQPGIGVDSIQNNKPIENDEFPLMAPRALLQFLEHDMGNDQLQIWTIDNYDGVGARVDCRQRQREEYKDGIEVNTNQYYKLMCELYSLEGATDELLGSWFTKKDDEWKKRGMTEEQKWSQKVCMDIHAEVETANDITNEDVEL